MKKTHFAILVIAVIVILISIGLSGYSAYLGSQNSSFLSKQIEFDNNVNAALVYQNSLQQATIRALIDINNSLQLESESHFEQIMDSLDNSVLMIMSGPANASDSTQQDIIFVDAQGNSWKIGTGFSINKRGTIMTARHVVENSPLVRIVLKDGTWINVPNKDIYLHTQADLAILDINSGLPPVNLIKTGVISTGAEIGFIGFPLGNDSVLTRTKTKGNVSALFNYAYNGHKIPAYVINSFVNHGNSGGPLFSMKTGEVIGLINAVHAETNGIGVATILDQGYIPAQFVN
ncbi:MAG: serine protease [archaeon]|jgi:S1-C subfamily serine protease